MRELFVTMTVNEKTLTLVHQRWNCASEAPVFVYCRIGDGQRHHCHAVHVI